jgi:hypothetical protein
MIRGGNGTWNEIPREPEWRIGQEMVNRNRAMLVAAAVLAAGALWFSCRQFTRPTMNLRPSSAVGEVLAEEVSKLAGAGGKVLVIGRASAKEGQNASGEQIASFTAAMGKRPSAKIVNSEWLPPAPAGAMDLGGMSAEDLVRLLEAHPEANTFVVFAGLPPFDPALAEKLEARSVKLMAVCGYSANMRRWFEGKGLVQAVVPRLGDPPVETGAAKTTRDWFDREFEVLTPDSIAGLPY